MRLMLSVVMLLGMVGVARADMYTIKIAKVTVAKVDGGEPGKVELTHATTGCNIAKNPGKKTHAATFVGTISDGKFRAPSDKRTGKDKDIVWCTYSVLINSRFEGDGDYQVTTQVTFTKGAP